MSIRSAPLHAVIGAGYGDEGKGLLVDALCAKLGPETVVVRHNGGAQAGHTVVAPDGRRHVFHHVGAGSFAGAATHLSRDFVANPILLTQELADLARLGVHPRVSADERAPVTTPYDMMVNQFVEEARGRARHGSCGLGFGETVERTSNPAYALALSDLRGDLDHLADRLDRVRREWVPRRLTKLGRPELYVQNLDRILSEAVRSRYLEDCAAFLASVDLVSCVADVVGPNVPLVFEGAQGLLLDQNRGAFPYVTRSNTGLQNVAALMRDLDLTGEAVTALTVTYVTRAYATRHGAGPLAHELPGPPSPGVADGTNVPNPWQGSLRYGLLDLDILTDAIRLDLAEAATALGAKPAHRLAVTCLDQVGTEIPWVDGGRRVQGSGSGLVTAIAGACSSQPALASFGPSRATLVAGGLTSRVLE